MNSPDSPGRLRALALEGAFEPLTSDERERMSAFEKRISAMGLGAGHW